MSAVLDRAKRYADHYREEADSAWREIKQHHDQAMVVRGIEDVVSLGSCVMKSWFRTAESWHAWVSEDHRRYDENQDRLFVGTEAILVGATQLILDAVDHVKKWGYDVEGESEFVELANSLAKCAKPIDDPRFLKKLRKLEDEALSKYERGELEEIENWGE